MTSNTAGWGATCVHTEERATWENGDDDDYDAGDDDYDGDNGGNDYVC